jgi:hypothetical protein
MLFLRRAATLLALIMFWLFASAGVAAAVEEGGTPPGGLITIPDLWLTFLVATILPIVTGLVKQRYSSSSVGAYILLLLSVISGWLTSLYATGGVFEIKTAATAIFISFVTAYGAHAGFLKNVGMTGDEGVVLRKVSGGIGKHDETVVGEDPNHSSNGL